MKNFIFFIQFSFIIYCLNIQAQTKELDSLYAVAAYGQLIEQASQLENPTQKQAFLWASALQKMGLDKDALSVHEAYLTEPFNPKYALSYANLLKTFGRNEEAKNQYTKLIEADSTNAEYYFLRAKLLQKLKDEDFLDDLEKGYQMQPNHLSLANFYVRELIKRRTLHIADKIGNQVLYIDPKNPGMHGNMGQLSMRQNKYTKAIFHFEEIADLPDTPDFVYRKLGEAYTHIRKYDKALEALQILLLKNPKDHYLMVEMAELYALDGQLDKAMELNNKAYALKDVSRDTQNYNYGFIFQQRKEYQKAFDFYNDCLKENPTHEKALFARASAADQLDIPMSKKIGYYEAYLRQFPDRGKFRSSAKIRLSKLKTDAFMEN